MNQNIQDIEFKNAQGKTATLKSYPAKAYLVVNVASKCGLTPQYEGLQKIYQQFHARGLEILGFPANEFLAQEPGTNEEIQNFCSMNYHVTFPIQSKIVVKGAGQHPLYKALTESKKEAVKNTDAKFENLLKKEGLLSGAAHDIQWNFEKFLLNSRGEIIERFYPDITPDDSRIVSQIEKLLT